MRRICLATALILALTATSRGNLILNGDFEAGNTGFSSGYTYAPTTTFLDAQQYVIVTNPHPYHPAAASYGDHTTGSGLMMMVNGAITPNVVVWSESVSVTANTDFTFSTWVSSWTGLPSQPQFPPAILEFVVNGISIGTFTAPDDVAIWSDFATAWNSGSSTNATIQIFERRAQGGGEDFALDDISLNAAVAEPSSMALLLAGLISMAGFSRSVRIPRRKAS